MHCKWGLGEHQVYMSKAFNFLVSLESPITFGMTIHLPLVISISPGQQGCRNPHFL